MTIRLGSFEISSFRYWLAWSAVVVVFALHGFLHDAMAGQTWPFLVYLRWSMIPWYIWATLAPLVFHLAERYPIETPLRGRALIFHLLMSLAITLVALIAGATISTAFEPSSFGEQLVQFLSKHLGIGFVTYWALVAIRQALHFQAEKARRDIEASRLATELAQSRLQVLKTQLQPHFLFNTLHAIVTLLREDALSAEDMLLRLSDLLRAFLEDYDGQEISLRRELDLLDLYLGIQRMRFKDRLTTQIYVAPDTLDGAVPSLVLQPIVENAIRHGIGQRVGSDCIEIETRREDGNLCIDVRNRNSTLENSSDAAGHGIGLSNTRLRLKELYGDAAQIRLDRIWPHGVVCRVRLPFRELIEADDEPDDVPEHVPA